jgi:hypothetical protein
MQSEIGAGGFKFVVLLQKSSLGTVKDAAEKWTILPGAT